MSKFLLTVFVIAVSTFCIAAWKGEHCLHNFHTICRNSNVIYLIKQEKCDGKRLCYGNVNPVNCRRHCQNKLLLDIDDFSAIKPFAFGNSNFTYLGLFPKSEIPCHRKIVKLTPLSFHGLAAAQKIKVSCMNFTSKENPFKTLQTVKNLDMSRIEWTKLSEYFLSDFPKLKKLRLSVMNIKAITLNSFSHNQELREITLEFNNMSIIEENSLEQLHKLTYLKISNNQLTDLQPGMFYGLKELDTLDLSNNKITVLRRETFVALPKLKSLKLDENEISEIDVEAFYGLSLKSLSFYGNRLETWPSVGTFRNLGNLTTLNLSKNKIRTLPHGMFEVLGRNRLEAIWLEGNKIHHIEPNTFFGLRLFNLVLANNELTVLEEDTFNDLHCRELDLDSNMISEIKAHAFRNSSISHIYLRSNNIALINTAEWGLDDSVLVHINKN